MSIETYPNYDKSAGYITVRDFLPSIAIQQFKLWAMNPENIHRGNACDGKYYDTHEVGREYDVWWTTAPPPEMWKPVVWGLVRYIDAIFTNDNWGIHAVDCITTRAGASKVYAHIDTPYRFKEFNQVDRTLGVQIIIPLDIFTLQNGATAYLPGSHLEKIGFEDLEENREHYNDRILTEGTQFLAKPGDVLMYDGRTLHSTMPNNSKEFRSALLINALQKDIIEDVKLLDNNTDKIKT